MKKKLAMRIASLALCVVFTGALFGVPKAKAVATEVAVGTSALAGYMTATGIPLTVINGGASTVTAGVASMASSYATATGAASSGSAWLSSLAAGCSISPTGLLVLGAAAVVAIGAFVAWLVIENNLESAGSSITVAPELLNYNGLSLPPLPSHDYYYSLILDVDGIIQLRACYIAPVYNGSSFSWRRGSDASYSYHGKWNLVNGEWGDHSTYSASRGQTVTYSGSYVWSDFDVTDSSGVVCFEGNNGSALSVSRGSNFSQPIDEFIEDDSKEMQLYFGSPLTSLDDFAASVPNNIANNTFSVTYQIVNADSGAVGGDDTGEGEGTEDDTVIGGDSTTVGLLQSILNGVKAIPESISMSIADVFTPSQEAVDNLASEVDTKLPFIPVLKDFGADLVYNLEHPEVCADGLGLTTVVDLGKGRGTYLGDTTHDLLDVSWYFEYKPLVDDLIVGFCWLVFLWNCYGALPRIIHGEGSTITVHAREFPAVGAGQNTKALGDGK